jgi:hypothetical protein
MPTSKTNMPCNNMNLSWVHSSIANFQPVGGQIDLSVDKMTTETDEETESEQVEEEEADVTVEEEADIAVEEEV